MPLKNMALIKCSRFNQHYVKSTAVKIALVTILDMALLFTSAQSEPLTKQKNSLSMDNLLSSGWSISGFSVAQEWRDLAEEIRGSAPVPKPTRLVYSFVLQKDKSFVLCWGDYSQGFNNPCRELSPLDHTPSKDSNPSR